MDTLEKTKEKYKKFHSNITDCFYHNKKYNGELLTQEKFDNLHNLCSYNYRKKFMDLGLEPKIKEEKSEDGVITQKDVYAETLERITKIKNNGYDLGEDE